MPASLPATYRRPSEAQEVWAKAKEGLKVRKRSRTGCWHRMGEFNVTMRIYWPKQAALDGKWKPPAVRQVQ